MKVGQLTRALATAAVLAPLSFAALSQEDPTMGAQNGTSANMPNVSMQDVKKSVCGTAGKAVLNFAAAFLTSGLSAAGGAAMGTSVADKGCEAAGVKPETAAQDSAKAVAQNAPVGADQVVGQKGLKAEKPSKDKKQTGKPIVESKEGQVMDAAKTIGLQAVGLPAPVADQLAGKISNEKIKETGAKVVDSTREAGAAIGGFMSGLGDRLKKMRADKGEGAEPAVSANPGMTP